MTDGPVAAAQVACDEALVAMVAAAVPALEFLEARVPLFETEEAHRLLDDYRQKFELWILRGAELATLEAENGA